MNTEEQILVNDLTQHTLNRVNSIVRDGMELMPSDQGKVSLGYNVAQCVLYATAHLLQRMYADDSPSLDLPTIVRLLLLSIHRNPPEIDIVDKQLRFHPTRAPTMEDQSK
jgi:hypothetical protein